MARIRTIKPEIKDSEKFNRLCRDARLLFILLWTQADDEGRLRGHPRLLANTIFPFDNDVAEKIDGWLCEIEQGGSIIQYEVDGTKYIQITNWAEHQKIDRPTKSRLPNFAMASRGLDEPSRASIEPSSTDQDLGPGPRTMDQDHRPDVVGADAPPPPEKVKRIPTDDHETIKACVAAYNAMAARLKLAQVSLLTDARRKALRARLAMAVAHKGASGDPTGLEDWKRALVRVETKCRWMWDGTASRNDWRVDFDFLLQQSSFLKLIEGSYDRDSSKQAKSPPNPNSRDGYAAIYAESRARSRADVPEPDHGRGEAQHGDLGDAGGNFTVIDHDG